MKRKGFTLVELLIVIAIMGVLATVMSLSSTNATASADAAKILNGLRAARTAAQQFYFDYPDTHGQVAGDTAATDDSAGGWAADDTGAEVIFDTVISEYLDTSIGGTASDYVLRIYGAAAATKASAAEWYVGYKLPSDTSTAVKHRLSGQIKSYALKGLTIANDKVPEFTVGTAPSALDLTAEGNAHDVILIRVR